MFLSATVGGLCVQTFGAIPLLLGNAATFAFSALCVIAVGRRAAVASHDAAPAAEPHEQRVAVGTSRAHLGWLIMLFAQSSVVVTVFNALLPKLVLGEYHRGAGIYGAADALGSLGFLGATWSYRVIAPRLGDLRISLAGYLACSVLFVFQPDVGITGLLLMVTVSAFLFGHARIASRNLLMSSVEPHVAGRVFGMANSGGLAATIAAMLVVAEITDHTDCRFGFAATAALSAAAVTACAARLAGRRAAGGPAFRDGPAFRVEPIGASVNSTRDAALSPAPSNS